MSTIAWIILCLAIGVIGFAAGYCCGADDNPTPPEDDL